MPRQMSLYRLSYSLLLRSLLAHATLTNDVHKRACDRQGLREYHSFHVSLSQHSKGGLRVRLALRPSEWSIP